MKQNQEISHPDTAPIFHAVILFLAVLSAGCAPETPFSGSTDLETGKTLTPASSDKTPSSDDQPVTHNLDKDDELTLKSCQAKNPNIMQGVKMVEVQDIASSISNFETFVDTYDGEEKRILIINLQSRISNKISLELGNRNTTYCLNMGAQITNKIEIGIIRGARMIEARQSSIMNSITVRQI